MSVFCPRCQKEEPLELIIYKGIMQYRCACGNFADSNSYERFINHLSIYMEECEMNDVKENMTGWGWTDNTAKIRYTVISHDENKMSIQIDNRKVPSKCNI